MVSISHLLNVKVTVRRKLRVKDDQGGHSDPEPFGTVIATGVPMRFSSPTGKDLQVAGRLDAEITHIGFSDPGQDIKKLDNLEDESSGLKYKVEYETPPSEPDFQRFMVSRIEQGT